MSIFYRVFGRMSIRVLYEYNKNIMKKLCMIYKEKPLITFSGFQKVLITMFTLQIQAEKI
jgi:hypothetical protein